LGNVNYKLIADFSVDGVIFFPRSAQRMVNGEGVASGDFLAI
jgi:hypothetical protein